MSKRTHKRIVIIGGGFRSSDKLCLNDDDELWSCNNLYGVFDFYDLPKPSRWFEIHRISEDNGVYSRRGVSKMGDTSINDYLQSLDDLNIPVYTQKHIPIIRRSIPFPLVKVLERFPRAFFNNSFAYMLALAIMEKVESIGVYGICMPNELFREYYVHRISTEYLLGYAEALGIKVDVSHKSLLLKCTYLYGYQEAPEDYALWQKGAYDKTVTSDAMNLWRL
jgi:hypothetical protein